MLHANLELQIHYLKCLEVFIYLCNKAMGSIYFHNFSCSCVIYQQMSVVVIFLDSNKMTVTCQKGMSHSEKAISISHLQYLYYLLSLTPFTT